MFERAPKEQIQSIEIIIASNEDKRMEKRILHIWNNIIYIISRLKIFETIPQKIVAHRKLRLFRDRINPKSPNELL